MTKHKVAELEGALLDAAVALAGGLAVVYRSGGQPAFELPFDPEGPAHEFNVGEAMWRHFKPSTEWSDGGPIIERERIAIIEDGYRCTEWDAYVRGYYSSDEGLAGDGSESGPTPLIAAMRAYVASKFGGEVELP